MKAMLWKEMRENARWALLAAVGLGLAAALGFAQTRGLFGGSSYSPQSGLLPWLTFGAPLVGLALGLLQILPEQRRDQWAFLVHRPASRDTIFAGKAAAGLLLYALATGVPTLGALVWASLPGHLAAPFDWRLGLPGVADILAGVSFYFAGLLTALRPARWYGSRALPVAVAVIGSLLVLALPEFWMAAWFALLFTTPFAIAAWGCFRTTGQYGHLPKASKFALGAVLYVGIILAVGTSIALVSAFVSTTNTSDFATITRYDITTKGQIIRVTQQGERTSAVDLAGHPLASALADRGNLLNGDMPIAYQPERETRPSYRDALRYSRSLSMESYGGWSHTLWYYVYDTHRLMGYDTRTRRLTAVGGPGGIVAASNPLPVPFVGNPLQNEDFGYQKTSYLVFPQAVYTLDLDNRHVMPLITVTDSEHIDRVSSVYTPGVSVPSKSGTNGTLFAVQTNTQTRVLSVTGKPLLAVPHFLDAAHWYQQYDVMRLPHTPRYFFWYIPSQYTPRSTRGKLPQFIVETDAQGRELKRDTLPPLPKRQFPETPLAGPSWGALLPPGATLAFCATAYHYRNAHTENDFAGVMGYAARTYPRFRGTYERLFAVCGACGLLAAFMALLIGRRCAWSRTGRVVWAVGAFWLGLYGVLLVLALDAWPARERCPNCGRRRVVTRAACEHCGAAFAVPPPDGTEIFDTDGTETPASL